MTFNEIVEAIIKMDEPSPDELRPPPRELIAFFVRWERQLRNWKQRSLADFANVSLSTVERVERAEKVSDVSLDRVALALGHEPGYLTSVRFPLGRENGIAKLVETFGEMEIVPVRRVSTESQIRRFAQCHGCLIYRPEGDERYDVLISELWEWFDLGSFIIGSCDLFEPSQGTRRREFYAHVLGCVRRLDESGLNVLGGVMHAPQVGIPDWKVAIISITQKRTDPGALKRRHILVDRRCVEAPANWPRAHVKDVPNESYNGAT